MAIDANALASFFVALGFEVDTTGIDKWQQEIGKMRNFALGIGAALTAAAAGVGLFVEGVAKNLGDMEHFAQVNHLTTEELQAFNAIARENHIDVGAMDEGIASLNTNLGLAHLRSGRLRPILEKLGIGLKDAHGHAKNFRDILDEVADKMQKFEASGAGAINIGLARRLGIDPGMVELLNKGAASWRKTFAEAQSNVAFRKEDLERAETTDRLFVRTKHDVEVLWDRIALRLMPSIDHLLERFAKWFDKMSRDPTSLFNRSLKIMGAIADWVGNHLSLLSEIVIPILIVGFTVLAASAVGSLITMGAAVVAFATNAIAWFTAFGIAQTLALWPVELIIAAVALLAVAAYEVYAHWEPIMKWFGAAWDWIADKINVVKEKLASLGEWVHDHPILAKVILGPGASQLDPSRNADSITSRSTWGSGSTSHSSMSTVNHYFNGNLTVVSPDPLKAGEVVRDALNPGKNRTLIRNAQSGVVY